MFSLPLNMTFVYLSMASAPSHFRLIMSSNNGRHLLMALQQFLIGAIKIVEMKEERKRERKEEEMSKMTEQHLISDFFCSVHCRM